jgi:hypothetical protein
MARDGPSILREPGPDLNGPSDLSWLPLGPGFRSGAREPADVPIGQGAKRSGLTLISGSF